MNIGFFIIWQLGVYGILQMTAMGYGYNFHIIKFNSEKNIVFKYVFDINLTLTLSGKYTREPKPAFIIEEPRPQNLLNDENEISDQVT